MGNLKSTKAVDPGFVEFSVRIRNFNIVHLQEYTKLHDLFQQKFSENIWNELRQKIENAINKYTNNNELTSWKRKYKCLTFMVSVYYFHSYF